MKKAQGEILKIITVSLLLFFLLAFIGCVPLEDIDSLIKNLSNENENIRINSENALVKIGKPAVEPLIEALKDKENPARVSAAKILGKIGNGRAIKPLISCLTDPGEYSIKDKIKDKKAEELYIEIFGEKPPEAPEAPAAPEMGEMPEVTQVMPDNKTDISESTTNAVISSDKPSNKQYQVFIEVVYALSLLCKNSKNEKIIADEINKIDIAFVIVAYPYLIEIGASGTEDMLIEALNAYGFSMMAEDFINSGNEKLEEAARKWAKKNNYTIYEMPGFGGKEWGSGKD